VNLKRVFVVTREDLAAINGAIRYFLRSNANIEYELNCTDRITRKHADIKFMQEFDNYLDKAITGISIQGRSEDSKRSITFSLGEDWSNVRVYATGGEQTLQTLFRALENRLRAMEPWYSRIAQWNFVNILMNLLGILSLAAFFFGVIFLALHGRFTLELVNSSGAVWLIVLAMFVGAFWLGVFLNRIRSMMFPLAVFAIGQGLKRHEENEGRRKFWIGSVVICAIIVGGSVSFLVSLIT
jgi:hypothetical protein